LNPLDEAKIYLNFRQTTLVRHQSHERICEDLILRFKNPPTQTFSGLRMHLNESWQDDLTARFQGTHGHYFHLSFFLISPHLIHPVPVPLRIATMAYNRWGNGKSRESTTRRTRKSRRSASVKNYLGLQETFFCALGTCPEEEQMSFSSSVSSNSLNVSSTSASPSKVVLVEIPEEGLPMNAIRKKRSNISESSDDGSFNPDGDSVNATKLHKDVRRLKNLTQNQEESPVESIQEIELDTDLYDMDNYMLSVFMNDDSSVNSKGTASTSSSSASSMISTRSRHRGAYYGGSRRLTPTSTQQPSTSGWLESMKRSSNSFFSEGPWSAQSGWKMSKQWDASPEHGWDQPSPLFDSVKRERIEI
jgi:hypothetical protein